MGDLKFDVIVLGAGIAGVSTALHLQQRGRSVALVDRRGIAEETSFGNAGIIQREAVVPYLFPRQWRTLLRYARNRSTDARFHGPALPSLAPWLFRYWRWSTPQGRASTAQALLPLLARCIDEHAQLMQEAGIGDALRRTGYLKLYRDPKTFAAAVREDLQNQQEYGIRAEPLGPSELAALEPHIKPVHAGAVLLPEPASVADPGAVGKAYGDLFIRRGGTLLRGDARSLAARDAEWGVTTDRGSIAAPDVVVALGPWSDAILRAQGLRLPIGVKRGYHMHYRAADDAVLHRPALDPVVGFAITPAARGIRVTTGAEFARRDAPATPVQLARLEPRVREMFPLAERLDPEPWLGSRPCLPDMLPVIAQAPTRQGKGKGLWLHFGHQHLGFTLGPVTARLLAEMMTGEKPFTDPHPYRATRF